MVGTGLQRRKSLNYEPLEIGAGNILATGATADTTSLNLHSTSGGLLLLNRRRKYQPILLDIEIIITVGNIIVSSQHLI